MAEGEFGGAGRLQRQAGVVRKAATRPQRQFQPGLQVDEDDGAVLELGADDAGCREAEAIAVEPQRTVEVIDGQHTAIAAATHPDIELIPVMLVEAEAVADRGPAGDWHNRPGRKIRPTDDDLVGGKVRWIDEPA